MSSVKTIDVQRIEILDSAIVEVLKKKTSTERLAMLFDAEKTMLELLETHLRQQHSSWSQSQITAEIARRRLRESS